MHLFTATGFTGNPIPCDEGVLEWVPFDEISNLELWTGDLIFLHLLHTGEPFFSLKLEYDTDDTLRRVSLNGKELDYRKMLSAL